MTQTAAWRGAEDPTRSVIFLNRFYAPDLSATAQMLTDLAEGLSGRGWHVSVIASRATYDGRSLDVAPDEMREGVSVHRVRSTSFGRDRLIGRAIDYVSYAAFALWKLLTIRRPDVIVAMSDPPFILAIAAVAARVRGATLCHWAQDVYPALAARLGVLSEQGLAFKFLTSFARRLLRGCDLVVGLGPEMVKALVREGARPDRTICIHNWADEQDIRSVPPAENWFLTAHNLAGKFVVMYSGNAGRGHTFDALCEAMLRLREENEVVFVFIGGGRKSGELRDYATANRLRNTLFLDYVKRSDLPYSLSAASVSVVTEDPSVAGLLLPSKTYGILASGRPIIFIGSNNSDVAQIVRSAHCGVVIEHDDPDSVEKAIREFLRDPSLASRMGNAARRAAEDRYSSDGAITRWAAALGGTEAMAPFFRKHR